MRLTTLLIPILICCCVPPKTATRVRTEPAVSQQESGTAALLIGIDAVSDQVAWVSGVAGTYAWTVDGGVTWHAGSVPGADSLQFRDVHALSADAAYLLSIGNGRSSRIYKTTDRGRSWDEQFVNEVPDAFFDCFDFWGDRAGLVFSDAVDGRFPLARTDDGEQWARVQGPAALEGEGGFAASGTCLITFGEQIAYIGTGNASRARFLRTADRGRTWEATDTPIVAGEGAGITTVAFRDRRHGVVMGGDLARPGAFTDNIAVTEDGGETWRLAGRPTFAGAVYGSSFVPGTPNLVAVGPGGASYSADDAATWSPLDSLNYWSVDFAGPSAGWAVGPDGRIAKISF